jgi:hypothetical protein
VIGFLHRRHTGGNGAPGEAGLLEPIAVPPRREDIMNLTILIWTWAILAVLVLVLAIYRAMLASHEDESIHVSEVEASQVAEQRKVFSKLNRVEFWGKLLTVVTILYGLAIAGAYLYHAWLQSSQVQG